MRLLVTGGAGFIGSHVLERALEEKCSVLVVDDLSSGKRHHIPKDMDFCHKDICSEDAAQAITDFAPTHVIHLAAQMDVRKSMESPAFDAQINLSGLANVVEAARRGGSLEHVVFSGSGGAMYGEQENHPASEDHPVAPTSFYGLSKALGEQYLQTFGRLYGIKSASLRFGNVYGPRQDAHGEAGVVAIFSGLLLKGKPLKVFGDGEQTRDYVYVKDVVECVFRALKTPLSGAYNVGTGVETSVNTLVSILKDVSNRSADVQNAPARAGEQLRSSISADKIFQDCGYRPATSLHEGLAETFDFFANANA